MPKPVVADKVSTPALVSAGHLHSQRIGEYFSLHHVGLAHICQDAQGPVAARLRRTQLNVSLGGQGVTVGRQQEARL